MSYPTSARIVIGLNAFACVYCVVLAVLIPAPWFWWSAGLNGALVVLNAVLLRRHERGHA